MNALRNGGTIQLYGSVSRFGIHVERYRLQ
jgi:hypothetical protein